MENITFYQPYIGDKDNEVDNRNGLVHEKISLKRVYEIITSDEDVKKVVNKIRVLLITAGKDTSKKYKEKNCKHLVFQSEFNVSRKKKNVYRLTGLVCIDIDGLGFGTAKTVKNALAANTELNPVLAFISPSGNGVKVVVKSKRLENMTGDWKTLANEFELEYHKISAYIYKRHGCKTDKSCEESARCCFASHDENCFYNPDEPYTNIPDMANFEKTFAEMLGKTEKKQGYRHEGYDEEQTGEIYANILRGLEKDANGDYIYTRNAQIRLGHRSDHTAKVPYGDGYGYQAMLYFYRTALLLYGYDYEKADKFLKESVWEYANNEWEQVQPKHVDTGLYPPKNALEDILEKLQFKGFKRETRFTTIEYPVEITPNKPQKREYVSEAAESVAENYGVPKILSYWLEDTNVPKQHADIRFYSALALLSGFAPNQRVQSTLGKKIGLNLMMLVIGSQGSGKGEMEAPYNKLIAPNFNRWCDRISEMESLRVWREKQEARGKTNKTKITFGDGFELEDEQNTEQESQDTAQDTKKEFKGKPLKFVNDIGKPTYAAIMSLIPQNNAKCVLTTNEISVWKTAESSGYINITDIIKKVFDNSRLNNETVKDIEAGKRTSVDFPEFAILASGTPSQYLKMFPTVEGGELRRMLVFLVQKEGEWTFFGTKPKKQQSDDLEAFFLGWYFYNFFAPNTYVYTLTDDDDKKAAEMFNEYVRGMNTAFGGYTQMEQANEGLFTSVPVNVLRVAALLQSLDEFEKYVWPKMYIANATEYLDADSIRVWSDTEGRLVDVPLRDYIELARERANGKQRLDEMEVTLSWKWMELAFWIVRQRVDDGLSAILSHDQSSMASGVNDPTVGVLYKAALGKLQKSEFTPADYTLAYEAVSGKKLQSSKVSNYLTKLAKTGFIKKTKHGVYKLEKSVEN